MDELDHSPPAAAVLLSRVWIDNSMRHQNGRSRAAVASSLLPPLVSRSLGPFSRYPYKACKASVGVEKAAVLCPVAHSPALSVVYGALCMCIRVLISILDGKFGRDGLRQRHG
jgi:hypothetical protein